MNTEMLKTILATLTLAAGLEQAASQGTTFTYQGRLSGASGPETGIYDLMFRAYSAATGGAQVGLTAATNAVSVSNGLFTVRVDLGANVFTGPDRWLEIAVKTNGAGSFISLSPRQPLTPSPYAIYAGGAGIATIASGVAAGGVTTAALQNDAVTLAKLATGVLNPSNFPPNSVTSVQLDDFISLGSSNVVGQLNVYGTSIGSPAISLFGNASRISTFGSDGQEQIRLWGPSWGEILLYNSRPNNELAVSLSANGDLGGSLSLNNSNGFARAMLLGNNGGGALELFDGAGTQTLMLQSVGNSWFTGGNLGVGKSNPLSLLDVGGNTSVDANVAVDALGLNAAGTYSPGLLFGGLVSGESISSQRGAAGPNQFGLDFFTGFAKRLSIANNGSVGIGTATPEDCLLDIEGHTHINDYDIFLRAGSDRNHGIGYRNNITNDVDHYFIDGPFVFGYNGGALGVSGPDSPALIWSYVGDVWISNNLSAAFMDIRRGSISFGSQVRQMLNLWSTEYGIGVQANTEYFRTSLGGGFAWFKGGSHNDAQNNPGAGGSVLMHLDSSGQLFTTGAVNPPSDRNVKENFVPVDAREVLAKLTALPIARWNYTNDNAKSVHLGPVAQDFRAAFGLGADDRHISTVDADGVALAAIQGLNQKLESDSAVLREQLRQRDVENTELKHRLDRLEKLFESLVMIRDAGSVGAESPRANR